MPEQNNTNVTLEQMIKMVTDEIGGEGKKNGHSTNPSPVGRVRGANKDYQIKYIWDTHREIVRMIAAGMKRGEIAKIAGVSKQTVTNVANSNLTRARIDELHGRMDDDAVNVGKRIRALAPVALAVSEELLMDNSTSPAVRTSIAQDILDRAGYQPPKQISVDLRFGLAPEKKKLLIDRAKEIGLMMGYTVEAAVDGEFTTPELVPVIQGNNK